MIELDNISKAYSRGDVTGTYKSVSFRIGPGEFVVVRGASGSGKSTLVLFRLPRCFLGQLPARRPGVWRITATGRHACATRRSDYSCCLPRTTALENVETPWCTTPEVQASHGCARVGAQPQPLCQRVWRRTATGGHGRTPYQQPPLGGGTDGNLDQKAGEVIGLLCNSRHMKHRSCHHTMTPSPLATRFFAETLAVTDQPHAMESGNESNRNISPSNRTA